MAKPENIEPHKWKPGQSGNPNGRPKGSLNSKTYLKKWLEMKVTMENPVTKMKEEMPAMEAMTISLIGEAMSGNVGAYKEVMDRFEGRVNQRVEMTGAEGGPLQVENPSKIDYSKLSDEALAAIVAARPTPEKEMINEKPKPTTKKSATAKNTATKASASRKKG